MTQVRVLHVVAATQRRGAEIFAADLVRALDRLGTAHRAGGEPAAGSRPFGRVRTATHLLGGEGLVRVARLRRLVPGCGRDVIQAHGGEAMKVSVLAHLGCPDRLSPDRRCASGPAERMAKARVSTPRRTHGAGGGGRGGRSPRVDDALEDPTGPHRHDPERRGCRPAAAYADPSVTRKALGIEGDVPVVLSMGALTWEKASLALLRVAAEAPSSAHRMRSTSSWRRADAIAHGVRSVGRSVSRPGSHARRPMRCAGSPLAGRRVALREPARRHGGDARLLIRGGDVGHAIGRVRRGGRRRGGDRGSDGATRAVG